MYLSYQRLEESLNWERIGRTLGSNEAAALEEIQ